MPKEIELQERRRFLRLNASVEVNYTVLGSDYQEQEQGLTKDISAGGICLIVYEKITIGDILSLNIFLPDKQPFVVAKGRAVWIKPFKIASEKERYDVGIEFIQVNDVDRRRIDKYVFSFS